MSLFILQRKGPEAVVSEVNISTGGFTGLERIFKIHGALSSIAVDSQISALYLITLIPANITYVSLVSNDQPRYKPLNISFPSAWISQNIWNLAVLERDGSLLAISPSPSGTATSILSIAPNGVARVVASVPHATVRGLYTVDRLFSRYFFLVLSVSGRALATYSEEKIGVSISDPSPYLNETLVGLHFDDALQDLVLVFLVTPNTLLLCSAGSPPGQPPQLGNSIIALAELQLPTWQPLQPHQLLGATQYASTRAGTVLAVLDPDGGSVTIFDVASGSIVLAAIGGAPVAEIAMLTINLPHVAALEPTTVGMTGNGSLFLLGSGFGLRADRVPPLRVVIGATTASQVDWVADSAVRALAPRANRPGEIAAVALRLVTPSFAVAGTGDGGTSEPAGLSVVYAPAWAAVQPSHGLPSGGTLLTVTGWRFDLAQPARFLCRLFLAGFSTGTSNASVFSEREVRCPMPPVAAGGSESLVAQMDLIDRVTGSALLRDGGAGPFLIVLEKVPRLAIVQRPGMASGGSVLQPPPAVGLVDACGTPVSGCSEINVTVEAVSVRLRGQQQAPLSGSTGIAFFTDLQVLDAGQCDLVFSVDLAMALACASANSPCGYAANGTGGGQVLLEGITGLLVEAGPPFALNVTGISGWALAGLAILPPPVVRILDAFGNTVMASDTISVSLRGARLQRGLRGRTVVSVVQVGLL